MVKQFSGWSRLRCKNAEATLIRSELKEEGLDWVERFCFVRGEEGICFIVDSPSDHLADLRIRSRLKAWRREFAFFVLCISYIPDTKAQRRSVLIKYHEGPYDLDDPATWLHFVEFLEECPKRRAAWHRFNRANPTNIL